MIDTDGSGSIDQVELKEVLRAKVAVGGNDTIVISPCIFQWCFSIQNKQGNEIDVTALDYAKAMLDFDDALLAEVCRGTWVCVAMDRSR